MDIKQRIEDSISLKQTLLKNTELLQQIQHFAQTLVNTYQQGGKVLFCGNGGSAADAQHLAAELSGRFYYDRPPLAAEACHVNSSYLTAVANDYDYQEAYARYVEAMGKTGDVLVGISTSGNSPNICKAIERANTMGIHTIGMTGAAGGKLNNLCELTLRIPSIDTPRIQEAHILIGHIVCEWVEKELFPQ